MMETVSMQIGWLSRNGISRHRPMLMMAQISLFLIGALFWIDAMSGGASFTSGVWGEMAWSIPAKVWAGATMVAAAVTFIGLIKPIRSWMVATGSLAHCIQHLLLSYSATFTGGVEVIGLYASLFFLPLHLWLLIESVKPNGRSGNS